MPLGKPFVTYYHRLRHNIVDGTGVTVWIVNVDNEEEQVGYSYRLPSHHYRYFGDYRFVEKYKHDLPVSGVIKWESRAELDIWINKQIYYSHQIYDSVKTVWFLRVLTEDSRFFGREFLPNGHKDLVQMDSGDYWILLRSGWRVFPVRVVNNKIDQGWPEFWVAHKLQPKLRLLFGAEQKWVFDVVILDEQYDRVKYSWVSVGQKLDIESTTGGLGISAFPSAWVPSVLLADEYLQQFVHVWTPEDSINQVFTYQFQTLLENPTIDAVVFRMKKSTWKVPIQNGCFQSIGMDILQNELMLENSDALYVFLKDPDNIRLLVFRSNGFEKLYSWFYE